MPADYMSGAGQQPQGTEPPMGGGMMGMGQGNGSQPMPMSPPPAPLPESKSPPPTGTSLSKMLEQLNLADEMDETELDKIGSDAYDGYQLDVQSKEAWDQQVDEWVKLAAQVKEEKSWPWPKASNVRYPLLATAAMQFAARAYPALVPADGKIVQFRVVGADADGQKAARADKLAKHMNYQLLEDMQDWEEDMDRLMIQLPIIGCLFKKTYFDPIRKQNVSRLVGPKDLVVNYWATSLETTHRKTEICLMTKNTIQSHKNAKLFLDVDLGDPVNTPAIPTKADSHGNSLPARADATTPYVILEQHTFLDLDDDGYMEPYIVTFELYTKKVLRIVARYDSDGIITGKDGKVIMILPVEYYTKYGFIPNPDGGFYDIGFGHLLGHINESANTIVNQLIDAGTLSNMQAGFIGKGLRLKMGETKFSPGEWKVVNATGQSIKDQIFPLPAKEPSDVLFKLLGLLLDSGRELASVAEIFTGKMPGQNTPATTTQATIEQGMKVFTAIYKRVYRALTKEFKKVFRLNSLYEENFEKARRILDEEIAKEDYDIKAYDVCPTADPTAVSSTQKQQKAQMLMQVVPLGLNMDEVKRRILEAQEQPNIQALLTDGQGQPVQPPVDPKMQEIQAKGSMEQAKGQQKMAEGQQKMQMAQEKDQMDKARAEFETQKEQQNALMDQKFMEMERTMDIRLKDIEARQDVRHTEEKHRVKVRNTIEDAHAKRAAAKISGVAGKSGNK